MYYVTEHFLQTLNIKYVRYHVMSDVVASQDVPSSSVEIAVSTVDENRIDRRRAIKFGDIKPKRTAMAENEADRVHSVTFYIKRKNVKFYMESLKEVAKSIYGATPKGKVSQYMRSLVNKDFVARGLLTADGEPDHEALENLKKANLAEATALS